MVPNRYKSEKSQMSSSTLDLISPHDTDLFTIQDFFLQCSSKN